MCDQERARYGSGISWLGRYLAGEILGHVPDGHGVGLVHGRVWTPWAANIVRLEEVRMTGRGQMLA